MNALHMDWPVQEFGSWQALARFQGAPPHFSHEVQANSSAEAHGCGGFQNLVALFLTPSRVE